MLLNEYICKGKQKLRCGYTTGSCATGATKAGCEMLLTGEKIEKVNLMTPKGIPLELDVLEIEITDNYTSCAIKKDSGDDPDITDGILVYAKCEKIPFGFEICGGVGIGTVTKEGLNQPVGEKAINSVPRQMMKTAMTEICEKYDYKGGIKVTVSIPQGVALAQKTFNPRIGIVGGISVIGTSGIVEPMSNSALIETIRTEENVLKMQGKKHLLLTIGNYSKTFLAEKMPYVIDKSVTCSNFIGEAIDTALELDFESVLLIGHIGKLVKLGAGIMNTHSSQADGRMEILVTCGVLCDIPLEILKKILDCVTVDSALSEFHKIGKLEEVAEILMKRIQHYLEAKVKGEMKIGALLFSDKFGIVGKTKYVDELITKMTEE